MLIACSNAATEDHAIGGRARASSNYMDAADVEAPPADPTSPGVLRHLSMRGLASASGFASRFKEGAGRRTARRQRANYQGGGGSTKRHLQHIDVKHRLHVALLNQGLSFAYTVSWPVLTAMIVGCFAGLAVPMAFLAKVTRCTERGYWITWVLSLAHLVAFGEEGSVRESEAAGCILMTTTFSFIALLLQAAIFALAVTRFLNPLIELALPTRPVVVRRDGHSHLSIRIIHPQGHLVSNMSVHANWVRRKLTNEGEDVQAVDPIIFNDNVHRHVWMPMTYLHTLDDSSPLAQYKDDIRLAPGNLLLWVQGYDEVLKTSICNRSVYPLRACVYGRWRNIIQRVPGWKVVSKGVKSWRLRLREWRPGNLSSEHAIDMRSFDLIEEDASAAGTSAQSGVALTVHDPAPETMDRKILRLPTRPAV